MVQRFYFIEALIILLILALIGTAIKYPRDVFIELPKGIFDRIFVREVNGVIGSLLVVILLPLFLYGKIMGWHGAKRKKSKIIQR